MVLPNTLQTWIDTAKTAVRDANIMSAQILERNAQACVLNIKGNIKDNDDIDRALTSMFQECREFADILLASRYAPNRSTEIETAREGALDAIDIAARALVNAQPNDKCRALGMDW